jgi:signal transduction histidine kinase
MRTSLEVAMAKREPVPPQFQTLADRLERELAHADRLLESFLNLARAQGGHLGEIAEVKLEPLITAALTARAERIGNRDITVQTRLASVQVPGSRTLLERMIENVIENAVRHNQPGGFIEIALTRPSPGQARLIIDSAGPVLDQAAVDHLVQPFKRLGRDRIGSQNGHGLGLSIVSAIAAAHEGQLDLLARPEGGLRVQITLPFATVTELEPVPA